MQTRVSDEVADAFKASCEVNGTSASRKLRELMEAWLDDELQQQRLRADRGAPAR